MPYHCIVPLCTNRSGSIKRTRNSFHRLPLNNPPLLKEWLVKIRRENVPLNNNSRVCSVHFKGGKKSGPNDVPVNFAWTKPPRPPPKVREVCIERSSALTTINVQDRENVLQDLLNVPCSQEKDIGEILNEYGLESEVEEGNDFVVNEILVDVSTSTYLDNPVKLEDVGIQNVALTLDSGIQAVVNKEEAEIQATVTTAEASTEINTRLLRDKDVSTLTDDLKVSLPLFSIECIEDDNKAILFYTGFPSHTLLLTCYNFFGPAATVLCYCEKNSGKEASFLGRQRSLTPLNEFFLTLLSSTPWTERTRSGLQIWYFSTHSVSHCHYMGEFYVLQI